MTGRWWLAATVAACTACTAGDGSGEWAGTVRDSAGVAVVVNPAQGLWRAGDAWRVEEVLRIGTAEGEPEYQFGEVVGIDVAPDGRILAMDQQSREVRVFGADGGFLTSFGRPGSGPGELSQAAGPLFLGAGDTIFVPDVMQQRVNRYLADGTEAGSFPLSISDGIPMRWEALPDRRIAHQLRRIMTPGGPQAPSPDLILVRGSDGAIQDTLFELPIGESVQISSSGPPRFRLFESEPVWTLDDGGAVIFGMNADYRIEVHRPDGSLARVITKPFERLPVTESDRQSFLDFMKRMFERQGVPPAAQQAVLQGVSFADYYPAFATMLAGPDGSLWVQHVQSAERVAAEGGAFTPEDVGAPEWDVFDAEGRYLGIIATPPRFRPIRVHGRSIYGVLRDELDVQYVVRLDIVDPAAGGA